MTAGPTEISQDLARKRHEESEKSMASHPETENRIEAAPELAQMEPNGAPGVPGAIPPPPASASWHWFDTAFAAVLAALAFALFGQSTGGIVFPDNSSQVVAEQLGLMPNVSPLVPMWTGLLRLFAGAGAAAGMAMRMHLLGRLCAAVSAASIYAVVFGILRGLLFPAGVTRGYSLAMGISLRLCAVASTVLLFCPPVCHAALAPHSAIMTVCMASVAGLFAVRFLRRRTLGSLLAYAAAVAVGCVESPGALLVMPWWMAVVFMAVDSEDENGDPIGCTFRGHNILSGWATLIWAAVAILLFAGGMALVAAHFAGTEGATFVRPAFETFGDALSFCIRQYRGELRQIYPAGGTLIVFLGVLAPAALAVTLSPGFFSEKHTVWHVLLYAAICLVSASQAIPASKACLWMYIPSSLMRAGACVLGSISFAFSLAFFLITSVRILFPALIVMRSKDRTEKETQFGVDAPVAQGIRGLLLTVFSLALLSLPFVGIAIQRHGEDGKALRLIHDYLDEVSASIAEHPWTVTDGMFDSAFRLSAASRGTKAWPLPYALKQDSVQRRIAAASLTDEIDRDDYSIGTGVLLREWGRHAPDKVRRVAVMTAPTVWSGTGWRLQPSGIVLVAVPEKDPLPDLDSLVAEQRPIWERWKGRVDDVEPENPVLRTLLRAIRRQVSLTAAETGMLCERESRLDLAREGYQAAREIDPLNLVTRYNLRNLLAADDPERETINGEIEQLGEMFGPVPLGVLMCFQGRIFDETMRQRLAVSEIVRAEMRTTTRDFLSRMQGTSSEMRASDHRAAAALAASYLTRRKWDDARTEYEAILEKDPKYLPALYGMEVMSAKVAHSADAADPWLERLRNAGVGEEPAIVFKALLHKELGEPRQVQRLLEPIAHSQQENEDVWLLWGWAAVQLGNDLAKRTAYQHLSSQGAKRLELYAAYREGDASVISMKHRALLEDSPSDNTLRKAAMGAAWVDKDLSSSRRMARNILQEDDRYAPAHFIVGMGFALDGKFELAKNHLLRAAEYGMDTVPLHNNLAMVCLETGDLEEARTCVERALDMDPDKPEVIDTAVAVALAQKRFDDAQTMLRKALDEHPDNRMLRERARKIPGFVVSAVPTMR